MSDGREEREKRRGQERREDREDRIDRGSIDQWGNRSGLTPEAR